MRIRMFWAVIALLVSLPVTAELELVTLVRAVETSPATIILPASLNGTMTFKPCPGDCDGEYERARLTPTTAFSVEGKGVKFEDFRKAFDNIKRARDSYALVSVDTKASTVTSIDIAR